MSGNHFSGTPQTSIDAAAKAFYRRTLEILNRVQIPHLLGGAYAVRP